MSATAEPTEEKVRDVLKTVRFPGLSRDIVSFGFVKDLTVGGGNVSMRLEIVTESEAAAAEIRRDATEKLRSLPGVNAVTIRLDVRPPAAASPRPAPAGAPQTILKDVRHTIAVASGKGGVGKSTVAANLALALERIGHRVGLMDSDIYGPSQQMMMGIDEKPYVNEANQIVPIERYGVKVMSLGFLMDVDQPVIWRGPMVMKAVEQFLQDVAWGSLDELVIDLPPGTGDAQLTLTQKIRLSGAVIVTTPQDVSLIDARKGLAMFQKVNVPVLGIIENMSYYVCPQVRPPGGDLQARRRPKDGGGAPRSLPRRDPARSRRSRSAATPAAPSSRATRSPRSPRPTCGSPTRSRAVWESTPRRARDDRARPGPTSRGCTWTRSSTRPTKRSSWAPAWRERSARTADPPIQEECDQIGTCAVGQAVVTKAGKLPAKWIIHAVGPGLEGRDVRRRDAARLGRAPGPAPRRRHRGRVGRAAGDLDRRLRLPARVRRGDHDRRREVLRPDGRVRPADRLLPARRRRHTRPSRRRSVRRRPDRAVPVLALPLLLVALWARSSAAPSASDLAALQAARNVGLASLEEGRPEEASKSFEAVRRRAPEEPLGWADGAVAAARAKDFASAGKLLAEALRLAPADARVLAIDGAVLEAAGDRAGALAAYEKAAAASPRDVASRWGAARVRIDAGDPASRAAALRDVEAALEQAPANAFLLLRAIELARGQGDAAPALAASDRLAALVAGDAKLDAALAEGRRGSPGRRRPYGFASIPRRREHPAHDAALPAGAARRRAGRPRPASRRLESRARGGDAHEGGVRTRRRDVRREIRRRPRVDHRRGRGPRRGQGRPRARRGRILGRAGRRADAERIPAGSGAARFGRRGPRRRRRREFGIARPRHAGRALGPRGRGLPSRRDRRRRAGRAVRLRRRRRPRPLRLVEVGGPAAAQQPGRHMDRRDRGLGHRSGHTVGLRRGRGLRPRRRRGPAARPAGGRLRALRQPSRRAVHAERGGPAEDRERSRRRRPATSTATGVSISSGSRTAAAFVARNRGDGTFLPGEPVGPAASILLFDYDNDGFLDLFLANPAGPSAVLRNDGTGNFSPAAVGALPPARAAEAVDFDGDGDLDLAHRDAGGLRSRSSRTAAATPTAGSTSPSKACRPARPRSTASGTAPRSRARRRTSTSTAWRRGPSTRLGLGARRRADVLRVVWTNGVPAERARPAGPDRREGGPAAQGVLPVPLRVRREALELRHRRARPRARGSPVRRACTRRRRTRGSG